MSRAGIFVVGSLNADLTVAVTRRPLPGETVLGDDLHIGPGGKGANQAVAAARLGGRVSMLGRVGADEHGRLLLAALADAGVDAALVRTTPDRPTGAALITVTPEGENAIVVAPGANATLAPDDIRAAGGDIAAAAVVLSQLELNVDVVAVAAEAAAAGTGRFVLNAAPAQQLPSFLLRLCDPLVVNRHEAAELLGQEVSRDTVHAAARELLERGPRSIVITMGPHGALVANRDASEHIPAPTVPVVDTVGAGDVFVGALAVQLAEGRRLGQATGFAVRAGAAAVQVRGAQQAIPFPDNPTESMRVGR